MQLLGRIIKKLGGDPNTWVFTEENQDKMAKALIKEQGFDKWLRGEMSTKDFQQKLSTQWAGLPKDESGKSYYAGDAHGNKATVTWDDAMKALGGTGYADEWTEDNIWIEQILGYEETKGSGTGTGLKDYGIKAEWKKKYDYLGDGEVTKEDAIRFIKEEYLPKVKDMPIEARKRLVDWEYNTGRDMEDLLLMANDDINLDQIQNEATHFDLWEQNKEAIIEKMDDPNFIDKIDGTKHTVLQRVSQDLYQSSDVYDATWKDRVNIWKDNPTMVYDIDGSQSSADEIKNTTGVDPVDTKTKAIQVYNSEKGKYVTLYAKQDENGKFTYSSQDESIMPKAQAEEVGRAFFESAGDYDKGESGGKKYFNIPTTGGTYQTYDRPNFEKLPLEKRQELSNLKQQQRKAELRDSKDIIADRDKVDDIKSLSKDYDEWKRLQKELKAAERVGLPAEIKKYRDAEAAARNKYLQNNKNYLANEYQRRVNGAVGRQQEIKQELERLERDGTDISERMSLYEEYDNLDFYVDDIQQRKEYLSSSEGKSREKYNPVEWFSAGNLGSGKRQKGTYGTTRAQYAESVAGLENNDNVVSQIRNKYNPDEEAMVESETVATKIANEVSQVPLSVQQRNKVEADKKANEVISDDAPPTKEEADKANVNKMKGNEEYLAANLDMTTVSDEEIDAFLNRSEEIQKATGVKGLVEKFGGMDNVMMMAGNMAAYKALSEPMPQQRKSAEWQNYMDTMKTRAQMGISPESLTLMQRNAERTYAGDVSNIGRMATSGQAALGALGQASQRKYQADMEMGVKDAEARERNFNAYGSALAQDEQMTQSYWERNVYNEADRKRELKGALIQSSVENARKEALRKAEIAPTSYRGKLERARLENIELQNRHMAYSQLYAQKKGEALSPLAIEDNEKEQTDE
jgi:hypothetical protein